ncbi:MAG: CdvA-like protein [Thermoproteota archaeon]
MFAWEVDFEDVVKQLNVSARRLEALNELGRQGKVSQATLEFLRKDFEQAVKSAETRKNEMMNRLNSKLNELKDQAGLLEKCLTSTEVRFVSGEIKEDRYNKVAEALKLGLEETLNELESVQEAIMILSKTGTREESNNTSEESTSPRTITVE